MMATNQAVLDELQQMFPVVATSEKSEEDYGKKSAESPWDYPFFLDSTDWARYQKYQIAYYNINVMLLLFFLATSFFISRCNILNAHEDGFYFACSLASTSCSFILYSMFFTCHVVKHYDIDHNRQIYKISNYFLKSVFLNPLFNFRRYLCHSAYYPQRASNSSLATRLSNSNHLNKP